MIINSNILQIQINLPILSYICIDISNHDGLKLAECLKYYIIIFGLDLKSLGFIVGRHGQPWILKHDNLKPNSNFTVDTDFIADRIEELQIGAANLIFDIYKPNSKFKKTDPGAPSFIICLVGDWPPIRKEVEYLEEKCKLVPLKFCHVNHGDVRFFSFPEVSLPVLP
ncbi:tRNA-splicing endonuclease subunit [Rhynchospora pubera]|uniref:tRNA-splicing endonuclease subunit n=1 Tax=Rhynchospora pubera TaxID=906938 RepID=A0AAV8EL34_9POAL|nr:tRNA-splicing endonuclease subunit [Rhynchospora pubera]